ncbi:MAG: energy transducer TonB [Planctomycetes bacterium]|nr:energy transducer TonB [Planctomycetota bacterium]
MKKHNTVSTLRKLLHRLLVVAGAVGLTLVFFFVLPLIQAISKPLTTDLVLQTVDTANIPPPPPPPEEEPEEEEQQEEEPPELTEEAPPLDLSQLELALNPGFSDSWMGGDFAVKLNTMVSGDNDVDALFSIADLDQKPRILYQPSPAINAKVRKKAPGTVYIIFVVDLQGRVEKPMVQSSTDPIFERPALAALKQWKFEPGKRNGKAVRFRMRVPITFPEG